MCTMDYSQSFRVKRYKFRVETTTARSPIEIVITSFVNRGLFFHFWNMVLVLTFAVVANTWNFRVSKLNSRAANKCVIRKNIIRDCSTYSVYIYSVFKNIAKITLRFYDATNVILAFILQSITTVKHYATYTMLRLRQISDDTKSVTSAGTVVRTLWCILLVPIRFACVRGVRYFFFSDFQRCAHQCVIVIRFRGSPEIAFLRRGYVCT